MRAAAALLVVVGCGGAEHVDALGLVETNVMETNVTGAGFTKIRASADGTRLFALFQTTPGRVAALDVDGPGTLAPAPGVQHLTTNAFELIEDVLYLVSPGGVTGYKLGADDSWTKLGSCDVPAEYLSIGDAHAFHTEGGNVTVFDRATYLAGDTTSADAVSAFIMPVAHGATRVVERDGVAWIGTGSRGFAAYDLTDPAEPALLGVIGDWLATAVALDDQLLAIQTGYDTQIVDVSDPRDPQQVAYLRGGGSDMVVRNGLLYGVDRTGLQVIDLRAAGGPALITRIDVPADCTSVAVTDQAVFVKCLGSLHRFEPTR